ncbi:MAG TPA: RecQ family ATP-dependent DNA helicase, partial [Turneriella sp.]|nr:RecQ family ATP-dependent DNA helicase [Turneriella sp.]
MSGLPFENSSAIKPGASAEELLHSVFGYEAFRLEQKQIIENVLAKRDTLVIMPTGGGKSLCYQIPALIFEGLTVVVSPLISLMQDQVSQLNQLGVSAVCLNSSLGLDEYEMNLLELRSGKVKLLYLAPETLFLERTQRLLGQVRVDCLTIDEAHCISDWGHDFRPEYRKLLEIRRKLKGVVTIALTATATARVRDDIREQLA